MRAGHLLFHEQRGTSVVGEERVATFNHHRYDRRLEEVHRSLEKAVKTLEGRVKAPFWKEKNDKNRKD